MIELTETTFKTIRNFYVACTHFSYGKLVEGYSLLLHFEELYSGVQTMQKNYDISLQSVSILRYHRYKYKNSRNIHPQKKRGRSRLRTHNQRSTPPGSQSNATHALNERQQPQRATTQTGGGQA